MSDEARKKILARRATFVAAALAGVAGACGKEPVPQPCLKVAYIPPEGAAPSAVVEDASPPPQPCLSPMPPQPEDAEAPDVTDAGASKDAGHHSKVAPTTPKPPRPCLKILNPNHSK